MRHRTFAPSIGGFEVLKGFKEFIFRGNVVELAIAVAIGAAFGGVVTQLTKSFIQPLIQLVGGGGVHGGAFFIHGVAFDWAAFVNAIINFLIVSAVIYFLLVHPMNRIMEHRRHSEAAASPAPDPDDVLLLREIRDLLKKQG
jgi:large conductance mechanosensitive channel